MLKAPYIQDNRSLMLYIACIWGLGNHTLIGAGGIPNIDAVGPPRATRVFDVWPGN